MKAEMRQSYSKAFKLRMVERLCEPGGGSAAQLAREVGISEASLSRWRRQASIPMIHSGKQEKRAMKVQRRPQDIPAAEKLRLIVQADGLDEEMLGTFLRREGIHHSQLKLWLKETLEVLKGSPRPSSPSPRNSKERKRIRLLERELRRKNKALAESAALLMLQKKVRALWEDEDESI